MTQQFHEGQEVEARISYSPRLTGGTWRKARIVHGNYNPGGTMSGIPAHCMVQFPDGTSGVFDETHIRSVAPKCVARGTIEDRGLVTTIRIFDVPEDIGS